jgi:hypothetical protein
MITRTSVGPSRQKIPVALLANEKRCARRIRGRARLGSAHGDKMRHCGYRGGREEDRLGHGPVILAHPPRTSVTRAQEEAGAIWPASGPDRVCKVFTNHWNLARADQRIAQDRSIPQTGGHCVHGRKVATGFNGNGARGVSHTYRHIGQKEDCVSTRSSVMKACGDAHRGQAT